MQDILARTQRGEWPDMGTSDAEIICSVGRQLAYRIDKLIATIERGQEPEDAAIPTTGPGGAYTPIGRLIELMRLQLASFPRNHRTLQVGTARVILTQNPYEYTLPILVTNLDNAQFLFYGSGQVNATNNAPMIGPETSVKILLTPSQDLYVVALGPANITVAVSDLALPVV